MAGQYFASDDSPVNLGNFINAGGEGAVYRIRDDGTKAAKIWSFTEAGKRKNAIEKVRVMIGKPPPFRMSQGLPYLLAG